MLHLLRRLGAPSEFTHLFRCVPSNFVERFMRFVFLDRLKKDTVLSTAVTKLNKGLFVAILYEIERLAKDHLKVLWEYVVAGARIGLELTRVWERIAGPQIDDEFTPQLQRLVSTNEFINADSGTIKMLVSSENDYEQRRGEVRAHACPRAA